MQAAAGGASGVLREPCEGSWMEYQQCSQDELQFKVTTMTMMVASLVPPFHPRAAY